jgi:hypothetical protein
MRWEIITESATHVVRATSSSDAVKAVRKKDSGKVIKARLLPKNTVDKATSIWRRLIGK